MILTLHQDVVNIEFQLGYRYAPQKYHPDPDSDGKSKELFEFPQPSLGDQPSKTFPQLQPPKSTIPSTTPILRISGLNRNAISGSFTLNVLDKNGKLLGVESVLSRWKVTGCANCQMHLHVKAFVPLLGYNPKSKKEQEEVHVQVRARDQSWVGRAHPGHTLHPEPKFRFVNGPALRQ